jgi:hypothetical protein
VAEYVNNAQNDLMNHFKLSSKIFQAHFVAVVAAIMEVKNGCVGKENCVVKIHSVCCVIHEDI